MWVDFGRSESCGKKIGGRIKSREDVGSKKILAKESNVELSNFVSIIRKYFYVDYVINLYNKM